MIVISHYLQPLLIRVVTITFKIYSTLRKMHASALIATQTWVVLEKNIGNIEIEENKTSTVYPFNNFMSPSKKIKTVHVAYAYDTPRDDTIILQVNHCLDFTSTMQHSIFCKNQASQQYYCKWLSHITWHNEYAHTLHYISRKWY